MGVQTEERNQGCNTIVLNSDTLFGEDNGEFAGPTVEISQNIETLLSWERPKSALLSGARMQNW